MVLQQFSKILSLHMGDKKKKGRLKRPQSRPDRLALLEKPSHTASKANFLAERSSCSTRKFAYWTLSILSARIRQRPQTY
jgi:hypothetical protein